jgi:hypothetical protein
MEPTRLSEKLLDQYIKAGSSNTKLEELRVLAEHLCDKIRMRVAENPAASTELLWNLAHDPSPDVRVAVGCNNSCDATILDLLVRDSDVIVRHGLAQNVATPRVLLEKLAEDDNGWVRGEALKSLGILDSKTGDEVGNRRRQKRNEHTAREYADSRKEAAS